MHIKLLTHLQPKLKLNNTFRSNNLKQFETSSLKMLFAKKVDLRGSWIYHSKTVRRNIISFKLGLSKPTKAAKTMKMPMRF